VEKNILFAIPVEPTNAMCPAELLVANATGPMEPRVAKRGSDVRKDKSEKNVSPKKAPDLFRASCGDPAPRLG
jgi:hypothetical protein